MLTVLSYNLGLARLTPLDVLPTKAWPQTTDRLRRLPEHLRAALPDLWLVRLALKPVEVLNRNLLNFGPHVAERGAALAATLPDAVGQADIVCLQEVFDPAHRAAVRDGLAKSHPFVAENNRPQWFGTNDGLMTVSRHPIRRARFTSFPYVPLPEWLLGDKGFLEAEIETPAGPVAVFNLHTTSGGGLYNPLNPDISNMRQLSVDFMMRRVQRLRPTPVLLVGDFNCGPVYGADDYQRVIEHGFVDLYQAAIDAGTAPDAATFDLDNPLNARAGEPTPPGRIDHVFGAQDDRWIVTGGGLVGQDAATRSDDGLPIPLSDHYGLVVTLDGRQAWAHGRQDTH